MAGCKFRKQKTTLLGYMPGSEKIVSMVEFKDKVFIATDVRLYYLKNGELKPVKLVYEEDVLEET